LKKLYKCADANGVEVNPRLPDYIKLPPLEEKEGTAFSDEELAKLWTAYEAENDMIGYVLLMIYTGMMPGELLELKTEHIDLANRQIVGAGKKTKVRQKTPISIADLIVPVVDDLCNKAKKGKIVTCSRNDFYDRYHAALKKAGVRDLPPYSCRHTTATALALDVNVPDEVVRKVMRWSSNKMLSRYAHPDTNDILDAVNRIKKG